MLSIELLLFSASVTVIYNLNLDTARRLAGGFVEGIRSEDSQLLKACLTACMQSL